MLSTLREQESCDVLVIGSGAAGLRAAVEAAHNNLTVTVISTGLPGKSTATMLSGGAFAGTPPGRETREHFERTLKAGRGLNDPDLARTLAEEAPARLRELLDWGIDGTLYHGTLFARGRTRAWGEEIVRCMQTRCRALGVRLRGGLLVTDLEPADKALNVWAFSVPAGGWVSLAAKAVVLATGGAAALYERHDNPARALGSGYALALRAGAMLQDMEFVQFFPIGLAEAGRPPFLMHPRIADLGRLYNDQGEELLGKYGIQERPAVIRARDRLSQALFEEIERQGRTVWLDLREVPKAAWDADPLAASSKPYLFDRCGADQRPLRVAPMAHYTMGGVRIDPSGATTVPGLFAAGEVAGGLHGANRMGGNALSDTVVFGARAGQAAARLAHSRPRRPSPPPLKESAPEWGRHIPGRSALRAFKRHLQNTLWRCGGIVRDAAGLEKALQALAGRPPAERTETPSALDVQRALEMNLALDTARLILEAALRREESRGAHFREDFPQEEEDWAGHLQVYQDSGGRWNWRFEKITPHAGP